MRAHGMCEGMEISAHIHVKTHKMTHVFRTFFPPLYINMIIIMIKTMKNAHTVCMYVSVCVVVGPGSPPLIFISILASYQNFIFYARI